MTLSSPAGHAHEHVKPTEIVAITMRDGVRIAAAVYRPAGPGPFPTLFAASPYRFDNNEAPDTALFLWRETGPLAWYLRQGYAYVHMDVRGTGRSEGEFRYSDEAEQRDLYEVIEWIAAQPWSSGKVGGIGQSYYARMQWLMAAQRPPHLACIAPYDAVIDVYRWNAYNGGVPAQFPHFWWNLLIRPINLFPATGPSKALDWDFSRVVREHPCYDEFWRERAVTDRLKDIDIPVFSIGVWGKVDAHLTGNLVGFQEVSGPKKLLIFGGMDTYASQADFASVAFHEQYLLPFYDRYLKDRPTAYDEEPPVRYFLPGANEIRQAPTWPLPNVQHRWLYLRPGPSGSVTSLNDGVLSPQPPAADEGATTYQYPHPEWRHGVVGLGPDGRPDPVRRVLTFTTEPLQEALEINGPIQLTLFAESTAPDTHFIVKLSEVFAPGSDARPGEQPRFRVVSKGWLRASHRKLDEARTRPHWPWHAHDEPQPLEPGRVYRFDICVVPTAHLFKPGSRIRLEIANGDSQVTDGFFWHEYTPNQIGADTIHHQGDRASRLSLPVVVRAGTEGDTDVR
ncbi:CocE/NonD family hydrolase [Aquabacterium sp. J223]|uniref:CocE/NonD family hydrolase n=1 Tax=Aquabacterium sp. J223 TaxID=2898431 RepID=UPI0021ADCD30|nr:CocE/NonD family hydrolase [Aquabacterium sp. J223]UUX95344.1 CocE/NonD family hydrolase [Aquabacterium sp. J223]